MSVILADCQIKDKVIQVSLTLNATFDRIMQNRERFTGKLKHFLAMKFGLSANAMRDFKFRKGSVIVEFKVSSDGVTDIDEAVNMMETEVAAGGFSFEFDGENLQAAHDSFKSNPYEVSPPTTKPPRNDLVVYIVIGVVLAIVVIIIFVSLIYCVSKSKKEAAKKQKSENLEFRDYDGGYDNKNYKA
ncbi:uncharacterized protein LOC110978210 [Acanthaster planci]|uniref:Uncharacterized protein LOC110978210 n=1 Tax=Acanthaster planci TaxID=133434 RepID=A0A8B7Y676_ACAPL|nr:uncharacterized protein LOC110978210 [Acanthaster planci]